MIVKYKGTDPHGKFFMGKTHFPDYKSFLAWVDSHAGWDEFTATDEAGGEFGPIAF